MSSSDDTIFIKSTAKRNGITTLAMGCLAMFLATLGLNFAPEWMFLTFVFALSGAIVTVLIGWFKLREPPHSLQINRDKIHYSHRCGKWQIDWDNVQRIDCPRMTQGMTQSTLDVVGFKLKHYDDFLLNISPRLASHIIVEQRPLLLHEDNASCRTGGCYSNSLFEDKPFTLANGNTLTGVKAILANRMMAVRKLLGYDVFIAASELDREPQDFVALLNDCRSARETL